MPVEGIAYSRCEQGRCRGHMMMLAADGLCVTSAMEPHEFTLVMAIMHMQVEAKRALRLHLRELDEAGGT